MPDVSYFPALTGDVIATVSNTHPARYTTTYPQTGARVALNGGVMSCAWAVWVRRADGSDDWSLQGTSQASDALDAIREVAPSRVPGEMYEATAVNSTRDAL